MFQSSTGDVGGRKSDRPPVDGSADSVPILDRRRRRSQASLPPRGDISANVFQSSTGDVGGRKWTTRPISLRATCSFNPRPATSAVASPGIAGGTWHDSFQSSTGDVGGRKRLRGATTGSASTFQSSTGDVGGRKPARRTSPHARVRVSILDRRRRRSQVLRNRTLELVTGVSILDRRRRRSQGVLGAAHDRAGRRVSILDRRRRRSQAAISWAGDLEIVVSILDRRRRRSRGLVEVEELRS